jgi:DNA-binding response OmpR family regulator
MPELRSDEPPITVGVLNIDIGSRRLRIAGSEVSLTPMEWGLLTYFVRNKGRIAHHQVLAEKVWDTDYLDPSVIKTAVRRLRKKLSSGGATDPTHTHRGMGYSFVASD